jgi:hypothetical protein
MHDCAYLKNDIKNERIIVCPLTFSLTAVLISQITQVLEGKKTKNFEHIKIPDDYKVCFFQFYVLSIRKKRQLQYHKRHAV